MAWTTHAYTPTCNANSTRVLQAYPLPLTRSITVAAAAAYNTTNNCQHGKLVNKCCHCLYHLHSDIMSRRHLVLKTSSYHVYRLFLSLWSGTVYGSFVPAVQSGPATGYMNTCAETGTRKRMNAAVRT